MGSDNGSINGKDPDPSARFLGLAGVWKQVANLGLSVVMAGLLVYLVAGQQADQRAQIEAAREAHHSINELSAMIRENRDAIKSLDRTLRRLTEELGKRDGASGK